MGGRYRNEGRREGVHEGVEGFVAWGLSGVMYGIFTFFLKYLFVSLM